MLQFVLTITWRLYLGGETARPRVHKGVFHMANDWNCNWFFQPACLLLVVYALMDSS